MMIFKTCENFCKADKDSGAENDYANFAEDTFNIVVVVGWLLDFSTFFSSIQLV